MSFTVVESPDVKRGLVVRQVGEAEEEMVRRWRGRLFATMAEAETFLETQMLFGEDGPPRPRGAFAHKHVDGLRIYIAAPLAGGG
jgi:hypothetical protein